MKLIFMRHGEARDNVEQVFSSDNLSCSLLTIDGIQKVQENTRKLGRIDKVYYSPIFRTVQTANLVREYMPSVEFVTDDRIREIDYGTYNQKKNDSILDDVRRRQKDGDFFIRFGKYGENKFEIYNRLLSFLEDLENKNFTNNNILIISHGSIISSLMRILNIKSAHLNKGDFICIDSIDFNEARKTRKELAKITQEYIKHREYIVSSVNYIKSRDYLSLVASRRYNDINFSNTVLTELCEGFNDDLRLAFSINGGADIAQNSQIICVCIFRNFGDFFQKWIAHYIDIGVNKFVLVGCGEPEELDLIKRQVDGLNIDVDVWRWSGVFNCNKECAIKQRIIDYYGINKWYLLVDSDELFIFPDFRKTDIGDYTVKLEQDKVLLTKSLMVDIYPKGNILSKKNLAEWRYVDKSGYCCESKQGDFLRFYGGMRTRVFGIKPSIQKISLFKYTGNEFIANDHFIYPYELNNIPLRHILLHYKFQPDFLGYYKTLISEGVHWNESSEYKKYLSVIEANNEIDLYDKCISMEIDYDTIFELLK